MAPLEAACAGAQRGDREARRIVDIERQFGQALACEGELLKILAADLAHAQGFGRDARLFGQDTGGELVGAHFQAEEGGGCAYRLGRLDPVAHGVVDITLRSVESDVGHQRGFAHAGASGQDDKVGIVQPADLLVDRGEAGGLARDVTARIERLFDIEDRRARGGGECLGLVGGGCAFGNLVQRGFGVFDLLLRVDRFRGVHRAFDQAAPDRNQFAQQGQVIDLLGQFARGEQALTVGSEPGQIGDAAQRLQLFVRFEIGTQRDRRDNGLAIEQAQHALVDAGMDRLEEMPGRQLYLQFLDHPVVDQDRT